MSSYTCVQVINSSSVIQVAVGDSSAEAELFVLARDLWQAHNIRPLSTEDQPSVVNAPKSSPPIPLLQQKHKTLQTKNRQHRLETPAHHNRTANGLPFSSSY